jgi:hypothetical protein
MITISLFVATGVVSALAVFLHNKPRYRRHGR